MKTKIYSSVKKRLVCAAAMGGAGLFFSVVTLLPTNDGAIFIIPCTASGILSGLLIIPYFIKNFDGSKETLKRSVVGGIISTVLAMPIAVIILLISTGDPQKMDIAKYLGFAIFSWAFGLITLGPIAIPIGSIGAVIAQKVWWKIQRSQSVLLLSLNEMVTNSQAARSSDRTKSKRPTQYS